MKINIVGGGPGGLYFALLMKRQDASHQVVVYEQNLAAATYGWGIVLSDRAMSFLQTVDAASYSDLSDSLEIWHDQILILRGERVAVHGSTFSGMQRLAMLQILQRHCAAAGVEMRFGSRISEIQPLVDCDLLVGAVLLPGAKAPKLITRAMLRKMKRGSVFVDISIDQGGCAETSRPTTHVDPVYVEEGVTHYCVANMPAAYARTATQALTNVTYRYVQLLADCGLKEACLRQPALAGGINTRDGKLTCQAVADAHGLKYEAPF